MTAGVPSQEASHINFCPQETSIFTFLSSVSIDLQYSQIEVDLFNYVPRLQKYYFFSLPSSSGLESLQHWSVPSQLITMGQDLRSRDSEQFDFVESARNQTACHNFSKYMRSIYTSSNFTDCLPVHGHAKQNPLFPLFATPETTKELEQCHKAV